VKGVALNLTQSPENWEYWERADPLLVERRPSGEHATDECGADTPGSKTASSCPTTVNYPRRATNQELLGHQLV